MRRVLLSVLFASMLVFIGCDEEQSTSKFQSRTETELSHDASDADTEDLLNEIASLGNYSATESKNNATRQDGRTATHKISDVIVSANSHTSAITGSASTVNASNSESVQMRRPHNISVGSIVFATNHAAQHADSIRALVSSRGGYLENDKEQRKAYRVTHSMTIRVPVENYLGLYGSIQKLSIDLIRHESDVLDVSGKFRDLSQRIASELAVEREYRKLLNKAANMTDIIILTEKLNAVRTKIESLQGDKNKLEKRVAWSTIVLEFHQDFKVTKAAEQDDSFFAEMGNSFGTGWHGIKKFIVAITSAWPLLFVLAALFLGLRNRVSTRTKSLGKTSEAQSE